MYSINLGDFAIEYESLAVCDSELTASTLFYFNNLYIYIQGR